MDFDEILQKIQASHAYVHNLIIEDNHCPMLAKGDNPASGFYM